MCSLATLLVHVLQVIDDSIGDTLVAASSLTPEIREKLNGGGGGNKVRSYRAVLWFPRQWIATPLKLK